jgi:large conductance mechanosensitive channel
MIKGFRDFLLRGNLLELAVAFVMGAAFAAVTTGLVAAFITPLIALILGEPSFKDIGFTISGTRFPVGDFIGPFVAFLATAFAIYFFVVVPYNLAVDRLDLAKDDADPKMTTEEQLLTEIRDLLATQAR